MKSYFEPSGYIMYTAYNGNEALQKAAYHSDIPSGKSPEKVSSFALEKGI